MDFNAKKWKLMRITMKKQPFIFNFTLKGSVLEEVNEFRDLGFLTNHHLSWNSHIDTITSKANRILGLIKRTCRGWKDTETLKTLYCTLVRSQVEYGPVVWSPYTSRNIDKLERIQWRGTKFILGQNDISYEDRLKCLNMLSLENRRYLFDVVFLYKVLNGYLNIELIPLLNFYSKADPYKFRHVDDYSLKWNYARTTKFKNSYFNRIVEMWNSLPLEIRLAPNLESPISAVFGARHCKPSSQQIAEDRGEQKFSKLHITNMPPKPEGSSVSVQVQEAVAQPNTTLKTLLRTATLLTCIGLDALDVYEGLEFDSEDDKQDIDIVLQKLQRYCIGETNEIYERYRFNKRDQKPNESLDVYVTALRTLAKTCNCGVLENSLIRDWIVIGVRDNQTRKKLLQVSKLTLKECIDICRSYETSSHQLKEINQEEVSAITQSNEKKSREIHCKFRAKKHI
ncbi:hypothetical protein P5673_012582 [Acropora cervicornis]|uniref:Uncharacterized protein n=1 Tax=Acropora cervicornis TaxID=6130 RepID=A0AAD9QN18_ACRCE|nr:hypothetical protein P5673_012582 [Acropora cervicornis]